MKKKLLWRNYGIRLNAGHELIIWMITFMWFINILLSLFVSVVWTIFQYSIVQNDPALRASLWFRVILQPITWIFNFMTLLGLLALFHSQGVKQVRKRERRISLTALSPEHITYLEAEPNTISRDITLKVNRSDDMRSKTVEDIDVIEQTLSEIYI